MPTVISVESLCKAYQLGTIGTGTLTNDLKVWWAKVRGKPNPLQKVDQQEHGNRDGETVWALKDINFTIQQGEAVGIIGRNGAGKSTLLKILSQITAPTSGVVKSRGRIASLLEVGTGFHSELTGRENIFLNGAIMGMSRSEVTRKLDEIVAFSGVEKFIDTPVKRYSSGMYMRLAFAVSAHLDPEILIVDEVLAVGDLEFQKKCIGKMENVAGEGRTVLFVSHNMGAVQRLCTRAILLSEGKTVADGTASSVVEQYLSSGMSQQGERIWKDRNKAPGDKVVTLIAVRSLNEHGEVSSQFTVREPFQLEIEFQVLQPGYPMDVAFTLYNSLGNLAFVTIDTSDERWQGRPRPAGHYRTRCLIPGDFLNQGQFRITASIATNPTTLHFYEKDVLSVNIEDAMGGARGNYTREWPAGDIRPLLKWETDYSHDQSG
jgi:lipopolysaccharide transport system ATP-binding protein